MAGIADSFVVQFITSDMVMGLVKPAIVAVIILTMIYVEVKPRLKQSEAVEV